MTNKSMLLASAFSMALACAANADTTNYVYFTGSTAARGTVFSTLTAPGVVYSAAPSVVAQGNATASKAPYVMLTGHLVGDSASTWTIVKTAWSGSEGGISDVANNGKQYFLSDSASSASGLTGPTNLANVDLAMADNDKGFSQNPTAAITGTKVCVITFKWIKEKGSLSTITNVTDAQLRALLAGGTPAALLTGTATDTNYVYITGRDNMSGTRVNALGETGYGIFNAPSQIEVNGTGAMITQNDGNILGDYGYSGGGSVATQMGVDLSSSLDVQNPVNGTANEHFSVIAYLGYSDASTALGTSGVAELSYNGVTFSPAAVINGTYGFWGNEYVYRKNSASTTSAPYKVFTALSNQRTGISAYCDGSSTISLNDMKASRNGPLSDPSHY